MQPEGTPLHVVRVIAAFVNDLGQIVPPPVTQANFSLHDTSAFPGFAMNAGTSTAPDFAFAGETPEQVSSGFAGNLSWANLLVFDYGGVTRVVATAAGFQPREIWIPLDQNNNGIPAEWRAYGYQDHQAQTAFDCTSVNCQWQEDSDGTPTGTGPPSYGMVGDGLVIWEEYRGFVVRGTHIRTHPAHKDLFVSSNVTAVNLDARTALEYARLNLRSNSATMAEIDVRVHHVWGEDNLDIPAGQFREYKLVPGADPHDREQRRINFNESLSSPVGLNSQKAIRIRPAMQGELPMGTVGQWDGYCYAPAGPQSGGGVPFSTKEVLIDVSQHQGNPHELKRTIAHEIGHAINVMHRGGTSPDGCPDGATVGSTVKCDVSIYEYLWQPVLGRCAIQRRRRTADSDPLVSIGDVRCLGES